MLQVPTSPLPSISISFAPHELPPVEPKSPFSVSLPTVPDSPRPYHLSPPPAMSPGQVCRAERHGQLSPLSPPCPNGGRGLERAKFEAMLQSSRERSALVGAKKPVELRKELAVKFQKAKQFERRARFLSKLVAPPSPTAASTPVTPPDSPAVFHFTLPSPGLVSPLELFEDLANHPDLYHAKARIEQVDFRLPQQKLAAKALERRYIAVGSPKAKPLPSLDQISQRLGQGPISIAPRSASLDQGSTTSSRLPSFLQSRSPTSPAPEMPTVVALPAQQQTPARPRLPPILALRVPAKHPGLHVRTPTPIATTRNIAFPPMPPSPKSPRVAKIQITTVICPPTQSKSSPTEFTEENITRFGTTHTAIPERTSVQDNSTNSQIPRQRAEATKLMFNKLSRRAPGLPGAAACGIKAQDDTSPVLSPSAEDKLRRRTSAPAELCAAHRGARHPVLDKPGSF